MILLDFEEIKDLVGNYFNGQYEVKKFLGEGSFAKVYLVKHNYLDDFRAMKIIKEPISPTTNIKSVFHEVMLATKLRHENVISIYDAGIMSRDIVNKSKRDLAFFVLEYVQGGDLEQYLNSFINSNILMPINRALDLIKQILMGLNTLHMSNPPIVHRDLKLNNILLTYDKCGEIVVKISDFGFSKEVTTSISDIDIGGTRPYMAPECFNKILSPMVDIYAVGIIFYQLLTNRLPYNVDDFTTEEMLDLKPWQNKFEPPSFYNKNVSKNLDEIVMKCLEFSPQNRYQNASEALNDVEIAINEFKPLKVEKNHVSDDYFTDYILNDSLKKAFMLAKIENKLNEAIEILESEVLRDFDVRKYYGQRLKMWKSEYPDVKLVSSAFTVNLSGKNYKLSCDLLKEAIAYNPSIKNKYYHFIDLWQIFIDLSNEGNLVKAVLELESLMDLNNHIRDIYSPIINILKTFSVEEIVAQSVHWANSNNLVDASNLMEFAVVYDSNIREEYGYKLSLWKQNMNTDFKVGTQVEGETIDYAIDLGTTDSILSYYNEGNPQIIKNYKTGKDYTPSAVLIDENNDVYIGEHAKKALLLDNSNAVSEFKHNMGFSVPFNFKNASREMQPEELSAEILKELRVSAFKQCGVNMDHAVICVPANSNNIKTRAINDAANLAGFRSHTLLLEPIAVALAYDLSSYGDANWIIYDLGGGTFTLSLIRYKSGEIEKIDSIRLDDFGGDTLDWAIVDEIFVPKILDDLHLIDFRRHNQKYKQIFSKLKLAAEKSKKELDITTSTDICLTNLFSNYDFTYNLSRDEFIQTVQSLIKPTFNLAQNLLNRNSLSFDEIEKVVLVGGSCISPVLRSIIGKNFDVPLKFSLNPLTAVAKGASIYAGSLKKPKIRVYDGPVSVIINSCDGHVDGRIFTPDDKFSFLGYFIEFSNSNNSSGKVPVNLDGTFDVNIKKGDYDIMVYDGEGIVKIDEKSPKSIKNDEIYIEFIDKSFSNNHSLRVDEIINSYNGLIKKIDYLKDYSFYLNEIDILNYLDRLVDIVQIDKRALLQTSIYTDYLESIVEKNLDYLNFSIILENIENKVKIINENKLFNIDNLEKKLKEAVELKDFNKLDDIYNSLMRKYIEINRKDVIISSFFNLKSEGIYINNIEEFNHLSKRATVSLEKQDYDALAEIVCRLYEIDERFKE